MTMWARPLFTANASDFGSVGTTASVSMQQTAVKPGAALVTITLCLAVQLMTSMTQHTQRYSSPSAACNLHWVAVACRTLRKAGLSIRLGLFSCTLIAEASHTSKVLSEVLGISRGAVA